MTETITAVIPIRSDSKNIFKNNEVEFVVQKIKILQQVEQIDRIIVSTDDVSIAKLAKSLGVGIIERHTKNQSFSDLVVDICEKIDSIHILWTFITCPFITVERYRSIVSTYLECIRADYDSLLTVFPYKLYMLDKNGALNFRKGKAHVESKDLMELYKLVNGVFIAPRKSMIVWNYPWGDIPYYYQLTEYESIEVKTECEYKIAQILQEYGSDE